MRDLIIALNLSETVLELFDGNCKIDALQDDFKAPHVITCVSAKEQQGYYLTDRYMPILSFAYDTIFAYDFESNKYTQYSIEFFDEQLLELVSWDSLFIDTVCYWWGIEYTEDDIVQWGNLLGIRHIETIIDRIKKAEDKEMDYLERIAWTKALASEIDNMK